MTWFKGKGDLLVPDSLKDAFDGVTAVVSCVGGFGSNSHMYKVNGTANINAMIAIRAASENEDIFLTVIASSPQFFMLLLVAMIICTVAHEEVHVDETKGTLQFTGRAKRITNCVQVNEATRNPLCSSANQFNVTQFCGPRPDDNVDSFGGTSNSTNVSRVQCSGLKAT
ncbi:uncharacterized protein LOC116251463 [Nymphaea colorata]|nr:uncharacterized protein LOC116251463 [Nymphaea colorata]